MTDYITTAQAAARLGCHVRTIRRRIASRDIIAVLRDGRWWVDEASVEEWQAQRPGRPGSDTAKMLAAYANPDIPVAAIAIEHGITPNAVYKAASRAGISRRESY